MRTRLAKVVLQAARDSGVSSLHVLFPRDEDAAALRACGMLERTGVQFHWRNPGYRDFEDFLAALSHDKRKKIRQERRKVAEAGARLRRVGAAEASAADWDFFVACYRRTYREHRSTPYLNREFFAQIASRMPQNVLLVIAERGIDQGNCVGGYILLARLFGELVQNPPRVVATSHFGVGHRKPATRRMARLPAPPCRRMPAGPLTCMNMQI